MKKLLAVLFVAAALVAGAFAEDEVSFPSGSWIDENWNGEWVIGVDGSIKLLDSVTGALIYDFVDSKITDKKLEATMDGVNLSFYCAETERRYVFSKELTLTANLKLEVDPDWTTEDYKVQIVLKKPDLKL